ncbi:hypothetical protein [Myroides odoratus]|uniref:hypothetical protein n=1 Tax=Myroides odoratus TaxID=256 RepID=UPI0039AEF1AF
MDPLFLIPLVLVIAGVCFMLYMNKKHKKVAAEIDLDVERSKYEVYKQAVLMHDFPQLNQGMKGKSIDAFTSASIPESTANKVQNLLSDGLQNVALSAIGMKLKRSEMNCFWVLSGNELHFFSTDTAGELDEHIIFDTFRIEAAKLHYTGILKAGLGIYTKSSEQYLPKVHTITFDIDGHALSLEIHDRLNYVPDPTDLFNLEKQFATRAKYQVVGERFITTLQDKFSNLTLN